MFACERKERRKTTRKKITEKEENIKSYFFFTDQTSISTIIYDKFILTNMIEFYIINFLQLILIVTSTIILVKTNK